MDANDDKINSVVSMGRELIDANNYAAEKIQQKVDSLEERSVERFWHLMSLLTG